MFNISMYEVAQMTKDELEIFIRLIKRDRNEIRKNLTRQKQEVAALLDGLTEIANSGKNSAELQDAHQEMRNTHNTIDRILDALGGPIELRPKQVYSRGKARARQMIQCMRKE